MHFRLAIPALLILAAACSSGAPGTGSSANPGASVGPAATGRPAGTAPGTGNGKVDCTTIRSAAPALLMVQLLVQLTTPDMIASIKSKQIGNLDLNTFLAGMHALHALDSHASPLGDPKAAIDFYEASGRAAQVLFATDPITQVAIDAYNVTIGAAGPFLGHQMAIAGAMSAAGC